MSGDPPAGTGYYYLVKADGQANPSDLYYCSTKTWRSGGIPACRLPGTINGYRLAATPGRIAREVCRSSFRTVRVPAHRLSGGRSRGRGGPWHAREKTTMATMTEVILIRHGETLWNIEGRVMGQLDSPLSARGEKQAVAIAERLRSISFGQLYSSDLGRAVQTANMIASRCNVRPTLDAALRERHMGVFQGLTRAEKKARHADLWKQRKAVGADYVIPGGGESRNQRLARSVEVLNRLADAHPGETIVVVSHDGILRGFLCHILGLDSASESRIVRANATYNCFQKLDGRWRLKVWGDSSHLQGIEAES